MNAEAILLSAVEKKTPAERASFLDGACGSDAALRALVEGLLKSHEEAGSFLEQPLFVSTPTIDQSPNPEKPGTVIGPYKLLQRIGEGGMGTVFMAEQTRPVQRKVALKVIKPGMDSQQVIARFEAERQALAMMDHVNIARVLDAGTTEAGLPYFVMELVHGVPITRYCDDNHLMPRERLELFVPVCQAIQHAHQKGIIHRDVKPSNVMVTLYDGKPVPKVIDFGVAKATEQKLTERTLFTQYGTMVGTLEYMSPEQAEMSALGVDTRSDIYSLGVLLYELLTGSTPLTHKRMKEAAYAEILRMIKEEEPPKPSTRLSDSGEALASISANRHTEPAKLTKLMRGELDWIVMKCLEKDRNRRYETANGFAMDVQRYLADEPVLACPPSAGYRFRKFARRNKRALATATLVGLLVVLLVVLMGGLLVNSLLREDRDKALESQARAERAEREVQIRVHLAQATAHRRSGRTGQRFQTLREVAAAVKLTPSPKLRLELRSEALAALCLPDVEVAQEWTGWPPGTRAVDFDPAFERYARADMQGDVSIRRVADDVEIASLEGFGRPRDYAGLVFSPDGRSLQHVCNLADGRLQLKLWKLEGPKPAVILDRSGVSWISFRPEGRQLAMLGEDNSLCLYDAASGCALRELTHGMAAYRIAFHPRLPQLAVASTSAVRIFDVETGKQLAEWPLPARLSDFEWHPQGKVLAASCYDRQIHLLDATTGKAVLPPLAGHKQLGIVFAFSHAGDLLASTDWTGALRLWDTRTGRALFETPARPLPHLRFSRDGRTLAAGLRGGKLQLLRITGGPELRTLRRHVPVSARISQDGRLLAVTEQDGLALLDLARGAEAALIPNRTVPHGTMPLLFEPSGALLTYGTDGLCRWPVQNGPTTAGQRRIGPPQRLAVTQVLEWWGASADGRVVAIPAYNDGARILHQGRPDGPPVVLGPQKDVRVCAVSPDGRWVATCSHHDGSVRIWEAVSGRRVRDIVPEGNRGGTCIQFSPDGRWLAACTDAGYGLWAVGSWQPGPAFSGEPVAAFAFAPDSKLLAVPSEYGVVRLVEVATGVEVARLSTPDNTRLSPQCFSPDGTQLIALGIDIPGIYIWDLQALRGQLTAMSLDWDLPAYAKTGAAPGVEAEPLDLTVSLGDLALSIHREAGYARLRKGDLAGSRDAFRKAVEAAEAKAANSPGAAQARIDLWLAHHELGDICLEMGELTVAAAQYNRAFEVQEALGAAHPGQALPKHSLSEAHWKLANVLHKAGKPKEMAESVRKAKELLETYLKEEPKNFWAYASLAGFLSIDLPEEFRDAKRAVALARKAVEIDPNSGHGWYKLGAAHYRAGNWKAAVEAMDKSEQCLGRGAGDVWLFRAMAHGQLAEKDVARSYFDAAVSWEADNRTPPMLHHFARLQAEAAEVLSRNQQR